MPAPAFATEQTFIGDGSELERAQAQTASTATRARVVPVVQSREMLIFLENRLLFGTLTNLPSIKIIQNDTTPLTLNGSVFLEVKTGVRANLLTGTHFAEKRQSLRWCSKSFESESRKQIDCPRCKEKTKRDPFDLDGDWRSIASVGWLVISAASS